MSVCTSHINIIDVLIRCIKQTKRCRKDSQSLGGVRTQTTGKRFKRGLKRDYKRGGYKFPPQKDSKNIAKQVRAFQKLLKRKKE